MTRTESLVDSIHWIGIDWGTSNVRAYAMGTPNQPLLRAHSEAGMSTLTPDQYEPALLALISDWLNDDKTLPVIICGMAGAKTGWMEAPYLEAPCAPLRPGHSIHVPTVDNRINVNILPGVCQSDPPDVMRGEETQLAGLLQQSNRRSLTVCLPGTHSKWVSIADKQIQRFSTFMTGELFALLTDHSVLKTCVNSTGRDTVAFEDGVNTGTNNPESLLKDLFQIRAASLLHNIKPNASRSFLSGLLIGTELAANKPYWRGKLVHLIGDNQLSQLYATALAIQNVKTEILNAESLTLAGLSSYSY